MKIAHGSPPRPCVVVVVVVLCRSFAVPSATNVMRHCAATLCDTVRQSFYFLDCQRSRDTRHESQESSGESSHTLVGYWARIFIFISISFGNCPFNFFSVRSFVFCFWNALLNAAAYHSALRYSLLSLSWYLGVVGCLPNDQLKQLQIVEFCLRDFCSVWTSLWRLSKVLMSRHVCACSSRGKGEACSNSAWQSSVWLKCWVKLLPASVAALLLLQPVLLLLLLPVLLHQVHSTWH